MAALDSMPRLEHEKEALMDSTDVDAAATLNTNHPRLLLILQFENIICLPEVTSLKLFIQKDAAHDTYI